MLRKSISYLLSGYIKFLKKVVVKACGKYTNFCIYNVHILNIFQIGSEHNMIEVYSASKMV